jgi:MFS family permease
MLLAGLGIGALASQLESVTVSSVPDTHSAEVGGVQNTLTSLGASIGTVLAGAVLFSALTTSFFAGIQANEEIPESLSGDMGTPTGPTGDTGRSTLSRVCPDKGVRNPVRGYETC